ncbi:MAG TPA: hypothetical protein VHO91_16330, partial [Rhodopila sp.]|nr:hypothetical protein [Rhodopila sp.]
GSAEMAKTTTTEFILSNSPTGVGSAHLLGSSLAFITSSNGMPSTTTFELQFKGTPPASLSELVSGAPGAGHAPLYITEFTVSTGKGGHHVTPQGQYTLADPVLTSVSTAVTARGTVSTVDITPARFDFHAIPTGFAV